MRLSSIAILAAAFLFAAVSSLVAAAFAVTTVEATTEREVRTALDLSEMDWAEVQSDGLQLHLTGTAPSEALRFKALTVAGGIIDASRVIDGMEVKPAEAIAPPRFSVEILRNDEALSLIGLIPTATNRDRLIQQLNRIEGVSDVADLLETADHPVPQGWEPAVAYAVRALNIVPHSKISVQAGRVAITAMSDSPEQRNRMEARLKDSAPADLLLHLAISAPRPVITPFTLRFLIEDGAARFDACSADTEAARTAIFAAARAAGLTGQPRCTIGLGVPSPEWSKAAAQAIAALARLEAGSVTFSDADITLIAAEGTEQDRFDTVVGELENSLPDVFALHAVLPEVQEVTAEGPPEFTVTLSPEGLVQMRGRLNDEMTRAAAESYARARFGSAALHNSARIDDTLPKTWPVRVLAGLEALSKLSNGAAVITPDSVSVTGNTGNQTASDEITGLLSAKLGEAEDFRVEVVYQEKLDPQAALPEPEECIAELAAIQEVSKINFEPGSAKIDAASMAIMDDIAEVLNACGQIRMEVGGHTDSQGRESMNQQLSQARAQTVLNELRLRRVLTSSFSAKGYGEDNPIADNSTEAGREANRRIEFTLMTVDATEDNTTLESLARSAQEDTASNDGEVKAEDEQN
ncbi:membrane protein [Oceanicola sp. 22II-s10i]|uniref:OmpA family protein n=1 Tax=Oceanicola sp. 22II-s10i TaxID=1317116 RepID=UPI000B522248|nr:OmpA family protein [Oceanicola sp. 22II-s10i]OWU85456.1 membrane protein [Oceanicola sp. 22II-s10i]